MARSSTLDEGRLENATKSEEVIFGEPDSTCFLGIVSCIDMKPSPAQSPSPRRNRSSAYAVFGGILIVSAAVLTIVNILAIGFSLVRNDNAGWHSYNGDRLIHHAVIDGSWGRSRRRSFERSASLTSILSPSASDGGQTTHSPVAGNPAFRSVAPRAHSLS